MNLITIICIILQIYKITPLNYSNPLSYILRLKKFSISKLIIEQIALKYKTNPHMDLSDDSSEYLNKFTQPKNERTKQESLYHK